MIRLVQIGSGRDGNNLTVNNTRLPCHDSEKELLQRNRRYPKILKVDLIVVDRKKIGTGRRAN